MSGILKIEILENNTNGIPDRVMLEKFAQNYQDQFSISIKSAIHKGKDQIQLKFLHPTSVGTRFRRNIELLDFIHQMISQENPDKLAYFQRILESRANTGSQKSYYLVVQYTTTKEMIEQFREMFQFLNRFYPPWNILTFIEEIDTGFRVFFEREEDFNVFILNIKSQSVLESIAKLKNVPLSPEISNKILQKMIDNSLIQLD